MLVGTKSYQVSVFSTFWYDFVLIYLNYWNNFRPIIATTVGIAGTVSYRLSLVQTSTKRFPLIVAGTIRTNQL